MRREHPGPGQESVWDYPRPPALEPTPRRIRIVLAGETIVEPPRLGGYSRPAIHPATTSRPRTSDSPH